MMDSKIIYIVGGGHSGSTLLDIIIASSDNVFSLGEAYFFNSYRYGGDEAKLYSIHTRTCTCGREFNECAFWKGVRKFADKDLSIGRGFSLIESLKVLWNIYSPTKALEFELRHEDDQLLFESVDKQLKAEGRKIDYLLDSSKDPRRLVRLVQQFGSEKVKVIYLVRDGRGYVNSYCNVKKWRTAEAGLKPENPLVVVMRWIVVNAATRAFIRKYKLDSVHISYDLFCKEPERYIKYMNRWLQINIQEDYVDRINKLTYHNIHGNLMKYKKIKEIRHDDSWRREMTRFKLGLITFLLAPFNKNFVSSDDISKAEACR